MSFLKKTKHFLVSGTPNDIFYAMYIFVKPLVVSTDLGTTSAADENGLGTHSSPSLSCYSSWKAVQVWA